jgi:hypothetical protein
MVWDCLGNKNQQWQFQELPMPRLVYAPSLESNNPKCVDLMANDLTNGQPLQIWDCAKTPQQMWAFDAKASIIYLLVGPKDGGKKNGAKCVDLRNGATRNATAVQVWDCATAIQGGLAMGWNQQWSLSSSTSLKEMDGVISRGVNIVV